MRISRTNLVFTVGIVFLLSSAVAPARANMSVTIFDNIGAGPGAIVGSGGATGTCIGGGNPGCQGLPWSPAYAFTPGTSAYLTQINVNYFFDAGPTEGNAVISLMSDSGGLPGSVLEQWTIISPQGAYDGSLNSVHNPLLTAGTQYWLGAANSLGGNGVIGWRLSAEKGPLADKETGSWVLGSSSRNQGFFDIEGETANPAATPEPGFRVPLAGGLVGLWLFWKCPSTISRWLRSLKLS